MMQAATGGAALRAAPLRPAARAAAYTAAAVRRCSLTAPAAPPHAAPGAAARGGWFSGRPVVVCFGLAALVGALSPRHASALHVPHAAGRAASVAASGDWDGKWSVVRIEGDGNCLFRAVAQGAARLNGTVLHSDAESARAAELREAAVRELEQRRAEIEWAVEGDFDSYCTRMRRNGAWGGEIELVMLAHVLRTGIDVALRQPSGELRVISEYSPAEAALAAASAGGDESCANAAAAVERMRLLLTLVGSLGHYELLLREKQ